MLKNAVNGCLGKLGYAMVRRSTLEALLSGVMSVPDQEAAGSLTGSMPALNSEQEATGSLADSIPASNSEQEEPGSHVGSIAASNPDVAGGWALKDLPCPLRARQIAFMHVGKTAGSSFHSLLQRTFPSVPVFHATPEQFDTVDSQYLENVGLIMGHFSFWHTQKFAPGHFLILFLRNPLERVLSSYFFLRGWAGHVDDTNRDMVAAAQELTLSEFLRCDIRQVQIVVRNQQTNFLGGDWRYLPKDPPERLLELASANLRKAAFVGIAEHYAESVARLFAMWKIPTPPVLERVNVTSDKPDKDSIDPADIKLINELNSLDWELYREAKRWFVSERELPPGPHSHTDD